MGERQWFILYVLVCLEVGVFLSLVPWSAIWERNYFLEAYPTLRPILLAPSVRGAVAGLGLANIYLGLSEVLARRKGASEDSDVVHRGFAYGENGGPQADDEDLSRGASKALAPEEHR